MKVEVKRKDMCEACRKCTKDNFRKVLKCQNIKCEWRNIRFVDREEGALEE